MKNSPINSTKVLANLRNELEQIDGDLILLLKERIKLVTKIADLKTTLNLDVLQENEFNNKLKKRLIESKKLNIDQQLVTDLFNLLHQYSIKTQQNLRNE